MRNILLAIASLLIVSLATTNLLTSCKQPTKYVDSLDTTVITPKAETAQPGDSLNNDSTAPSAAGDSTATNGNALTVTGKVIDGAMNSVSVEIEPGNSKEFSYSQLDRNNSEVYYNWEIDDKITVTYIETMSDGEPVDSVISIQKAQ